MGSRVPVEPGFLAAHVLTRSGDGAIHGFVPGQLTRHCGQHMGITNGPSGGGISHQTGGHKTFHFFHQACVEHGVRALFYARVQPFCSGSKPQNTGSPPWRLVDRWLRCGKRFSGQLNYFKGADGTSWVFVFNHSSGSRINGGKFVVERCDSNIVEALFVTGTDGCVCGWEGPGVEKRLHIQHGPTNENGNVTPSHDRFDIADRGLLIARY